LKLFWQGFLYPIRKLRGGNKLIWKVFVFYMETKWHLFSFVFRIPKSWLNIIYVASDLFRVYFSLLYAALEFSISDLSLYIYIYILWPLFKLSLISVY
jgi:hypothetical protein